MATLLVLYGTPTDGTAFDDYYFGTHVALAKKIPNLARYSVTTSPPTGPDGSASPYHMVATLEFDSLADLGAGLGAPEGKAAAGDLANFATGGVTLYVCDTKDL